MDDDGAAARAKARAEVAMYLAVTGRLDPAFQLPPDLLYAAAGEHEQAGSLISDDVLDLFAFSGTPDKVAAQAQRLIDVGASRIEFGTPNGLTDRSGVELLGRRVLPNLDRRG